MSPTMQDPATIAAALGQDAPYEPVPGRWTQDRIWSWYNELPWQAGTNYYPATAINQIEMWQASTWDPETIEKELGWAEDLGFNTHRVYLHNLVWEDDEHGFYSRMDRFLDICAGHGMRPFFVFFDDCHCPVAELGPQPLPVPGYHNSGWVTCPVRALALRFARGEATDDDAARLRGYVQRTMERFRDDDRVLMWELYNEPGHGSGDEDEKGGDLADTTFGDGACRLVQASWEWAREVAPSQPVCSTSQGCDGDINWSINVLNSDVQSIHNYRDPDSVQATIDHFTQFGRPLFMTEYLARDRGSTFPAVMPVLKERNVAAVNWGFVSGKAGTVWNWESRRRDGAFVKAEDLREAGEVAGRGEPLPEPAVWFHDILRPDGTPFSVEEVETIRSLTKGE